MTDNKVIYVVHICLEDNDIIRTFSTKNKAFGYVKEYIEADSESEWEKSQSSMQGMWFDGESGYIYLEQTILDKTED